MNGGNGNETVAAGDAWPGRPTELTRRSLVAALATIAAGAMLAPECAAAQAKTPAKRRRIDVHHHFTPPAYIQTLTEELNPHVPLDRVMSNWTPEHSLADMDKGGVTTAIISITTPGLWFGDPAVSRKLARACNDYGAKLMADHPGRFGLFAAMPLPDIDGTLAEIAYALDTLHADGIAFFTSYGNKWLGDPAFNPVFEELNRRKAVVSTHPTSPQCCANLIPLANDSEIEYGTDTTRAIVRMIYSGSSQRYPDIHMIFAHAGGTMPYLIRRFLKDTVREPLKDILPNGFLPEARRFYYDIAQAAIRPPMLALKAVVPVSHLLFGTDYPYLTAAENVEGLKQCGVFDARELRAIDENAATFLPRFKV